MGGNSQSNSFIFPSTFLVKRCFIGNIYEKEVIKSLTQENVKKGKG